MDRESRRQQIKYELIETAQGRAIIRLAIDNILVLIETAFRICQNENSQVSFRSGVDL